MRTIYVNQYSGISSDERTPGNFARTLTNFDALTNPYKLLPYRDSESADASGTTNKIRDFAIALRTGTTYELYGLGQTAGGLGKVFFKDLTTGGSGDLGDNSWQTTTNNASGSSVSPGVFVYYKTTGLIYGIRSNQYVFAYDPSGGAGWNDSSADLTSVTNTANGLVHSKDDILYLPYDNKIAKNNAGSWTVAALTLPSQYYITSLSEYGNYLAIACAPISGIGRSRVFLWDRDSSVTTLAESIDWGEGVINVLDTIEGYLVGISLSGANQTRFMNRVTFRYYAGAGGAIKFLEMTDSATSSSLSKLKQVINQRLYFMMRMTVNGTVREGVWSIGRPASKFTLYHERTPANDTALGNGALQGFFSVGDFLFIASTDNSGNAQLYKTNDTASYTATSTVETQINPDMPEAERPLLKNLVSIGATYDALPAAGQVVVEAKFDQGSYQTVFTETTDGRTYTEPFTRLASGNFPNPFKEIEFREKSTGGAVPTGIVYKYEVVASNA